MSSGGPYEFSLDLRWSDVDQRGHVNNVQIVALAAEARMRFHLTHLDLAVDEMEWLVAHQSVDYHTEVTYGTALWMEVGILSVGRKSYRLRQRGLQNDTPAFTVETVHVLNDGSGSSRLMIPKERESLARGLWAGAAGT